MRLPKGRFERLIIKGALWVAIAFLVVLSVFLLGATWEVYQKQESARAERDVALSAHEDLEKRKEKLSEDLASLESERGLETEFRKRFPVVKDGEEVIVLVDAKDQTPDDAAVEERGFWGTVKGWFGF